MATVSTTSPNELSSPSQLPTFVFPARASPSSAPASFSRATGRRPLSTGPDIIPSFSFNPSTTPVESSVTSPPLSPSFANFDLSNTPKSSVHRRGASEFIGGDGKVSSSAGLMSTSSTQGDNALPPPNPGRRGHAHRRSAAVSAHDIRMILNPTTPNVVTPPRGGSAPSSPSANEIKLGLDLSKPTTSDDASPKALNRVRVGFSDNVEFIPRPLSVVSSDTSSTVTMRPSHSVSGSLSSIVSGTASPPNKDLLALPSPNLRGVDWRPRTASAIPEPIKDTSRQADNCPSSQRRGSMPLLDDIALVAPPSPRKKWSFFGHETASGNSSPNRSRPVSSTSIERTPELNLAIPEPSSPKINIIDMQMSSIEPSSSRRSSISRKSGKKQKKVKSWAGSILSRKSRTRSQKKKTGRRSATPPMRPYTAMSDSATLNHPSLTIPEDYPSPSLGQQQDFASWKPRQVSPQDDDAMSPIIDLDAALGPFNTPSNYDAAWDASQKTSSKRRMHSAAGMGGFIGPGMHYHRRAESAPEMVPFENRFGIHRLGSSSTMADVFEEDEEDDEWEDTKASSDKESLNRTDEDEQNALGIDIKVVDAEVSDSDKSMDFESCEISPRAVTRKSSGLAEAERRKLSSSTKSEHSNTSLKDELILEEKSANQIEIADDSIPPRPDSGAQSSESTATPPFRPRPAKDLAPVEINPFSLQSPFLSPNSPHSTIQSSFPSPRSPFSYDTQRISTAPSSVADENPFQSLLLGEPGPELRMSVDDVPSLTSSNSTMTRDSGANPGYVFRDGQRSVSVSSASGPTRKRSSMASLSRLISSSHGERSKLSIESRAPSNPEGDRRDKESKSRRISRMIQFWKPKEIKEFKEST